MPTLIEDPELEEAVLAKRREFGGDRYDEVWDGVYVMAPIANNEHQELQGSLTAILTALIGFPKLGRVLPGANISDRASEWTENYRVPDVLVFLNGNGALDRKSHWLGGPDFAVEIVSPYDRSRKKIDFYTSVGVRELILIDRNPWQLELFQVANGTLQPAGITTESNGLMLKCQTVPISLKLVHGEQRPVIAVTASDGQSWMI